MRDFTSPQTYTVHSEDGKWHKDYKVSFNYPTTPTTTQLLGFEHFELDATGQLPPMVRNRPDRRNEPAPFILGFGQQCLRHYRYG